MPSKLYLSRFVLRADHDAVMPVAPTILEDYQAIPKLWTMAGVLYSPQDDFQADILGQLYDREESLTWFDGKTAEEHGMIN
jgi:hypothetical protein